MANGSNPTVRIEADGTVVLSPDAAYLLRLRPDDELLFFYSSPHRTFTIDLSPFDNSGTVAKPGANGEFIADKALDFVLQFEPLRAMTVEAHFDRFGKFLIVRMDGIQRCAHRRKHTGLKERSA